MLNIVLSTGIFCDVLAAIPSFALVAQSLSRVKFKIGHMLSTARKRSEIRRYLRIVV